MTTLLHNPPPWPSAFPNQRILPELSDEYMAKTEKDWMLVRTDVGDVVYFGSKPAFVAKSPTPF